MLSAIFAGLVPKKRVSSYSQAGNKCKILFVPDIISVFCPIINHHRLLSLDGIIKILRENNLDKEKCDKIRSAFTRDPDLSVISYTQNIHKILIRCEMKDFLLIESKALEDGGKIIIEIH